MSEHLELLLFCRQYGIAPTDPRVREMPEEDLALHVESWLVMFGGENVSATQCEVCGGWSYLTRCPVCPGRPPFSLAARTADALEAREARGEKVDWAKEFDALVFPDAVKS